MNETEKGYKKNSKRCAVSHGEVPNQTNGRKSCDEILENLQHSFTEDMEHLVKVLPEELWILITDKIQDPFHLNNLVAASPYFREILQPRRVEYLAPKVIPILMKWIGKNPLSVLDISADIHDFKEDYKDGVNGHVKLTWWLRTICRCWDTAITTSTLQHPSHFELDGVYLQELKFNREDENPEEIEDYSSYSNIEYESEPVAYRNLYYADQVNRFLQAFDSFPPTRNPFFHKTLVIQDLPRSFLSKQQTRDFWKSLTPLLRKYGKHIWYCKIKLNNGIMGSSYYFQVREWLQLMPNLKVFHWAYPVVWSDLEDSEGNDFGSRVPIYLKCNLEDKVREYPLPTLKDLQVFKTDDLPYPVFREFIKRNDHISKLQFHRRFPPPPQYQEFYQYDFANGLRNITELSLVIWNKEEVEELEASASTISWSQLKKLSFYWGTYSSDYDGYETWPKIFSCMEKKFQTASLTHLTLCLPTAPGKLGGSNERNLSGLRLNLPKIQFLKIIVPDREINLDFMLPVAITLTDLHVVLDCGKAWNGRLRDRGAKLNPDGFSKSTIEFYGHRDYLLGSNIWTLFPKLQTISFEEIFSTRPRNGYRATRKAALSSLQKH